MQKTTQTHTKTKKYNLNGGLVFTFSSPGGDSPLCPPSVMPLNEMNEWN